MDPTDAPSGEAETAPNSDTDQAGRADRTAGGPQPARSTLRRVVVVALGGVVAALLVILVVNTFSSDGDDGTESGIETLDPNGTYPLPEPGEVDPVAIFAAPVDRPDGSETTIADELDGRPVLVNLWASTCPPCIEEMPWLDSVHRDDDRVQIIGIAAEVRQDQARSMAERTGITYDWFQDPRGGVMAATESVGLPDTFLLTPDGRVLASKVGAFSGEDEIRSWIDEHLEQA